MKITGFATGSDKETAVEDKQAAEKERSTPPRAAYTPESFKKADDKVSSAINIARRPLSFFTSRPLSGVSEVVKDAFSVGDDNLFDAAADLGFGKALSRSYKQGTGEEISREAASREELGGLGSLAIEFGASLTPGGGAARIGKGLEEVFTKGPGGVARIARAMKSGAVEGAAAGLLENGVSMETLGDTTFGTVFGAAGQALLGEAVPWMVKYGVGANRTARRVGKILIDQGIPGVRRGGVTPDNMRAAYDEMTERDVGLFDVDLGDQKAAETSRRLTDLVAKSSFAQVVPGTPAKDWERAAEEHIKTIGAVQKSIDDANTRIFTRLTNTLGIPESRFARWQNTQTDLGEFKKQYERMTDTTVPGKGGAKQVRYKNIKNSLSERVAGNLKLGKIEDIGGAGQKLWDEALLELRPKKQFAHTGGLKRSAHDADAAEVDYDADLDTATFNMKQILDARKLIQARIRPKSLQEGTSVDKESIAAGQAIIKALDAELASRTFGNSDRLRATYAKYLGMQDAAEQGRMFHRSGVDEKEDTGQSLVEYISSLDDPDLQDAVRTGYAASIMEDVAENTAPVAIKKLVGDVDGDVDFSDVSKVKTAGMNRLRAVLGDEKAESLIRESLNDVDTVRMKDELASILNSKTGSPAAVNGVIRDGDGMLLLGGATYGENDIMSNATIGAMMRRMNSLGEKEAALASRLVNKTGKEATAEIEEFLKRYEKTQSVNTGALRRTTLGDDASSADLPEEDKPKKKSVGGLLDGMSFGD